MKLRCLPVLALVISAVPAFSANWWEEMDYGRFISATYNTQNHQGADGKLVKGRNTLQTKTGCATNKGIAVKLGSGDAAQLFDTECLRMSGGWTGGFLRLQGVVFEGGHGPNPSPAENATMLFQVNYGPGWSKGDDLADPRKLPVGKRKDQVEKGQPFFADIPFGPLPREWAKYRGLYLSGDNVVFAYTVGAATVLEMPGQEKVGEHTVLTRTFNVMAPGAASKVVLADGPDGSKAEVAGDHAIAPNSESNPDSRVVIGVVGAPAGAKLEANGSRVTLRLPALAAGQAFKVVYTQANAPDAAAAGDALKKAAAPGDLKTFLKGGAPHWAEVVKTQGTLGDADQKVRAGKIEAQLAKETDEKKKAELKGKVAAIVNEAYVVDNLAAPLDNPYKSKIRIGGLDFFKDGRIAFSTWSGDVWIGTGIDAGLQNISWKRFATGIFHGLGLKIVDDKIYVLGRDQITRLSDLNNDGEADLYENFNNDVQVTPGFHEFTFDLQTDPQGNFFFLKGGPVSPGGRGWGPLSDHSGCIFKVSKDGTKFDVYATGLRAPNGMGVGPNGEVTSGDNQGTWVPADYIHVVKQGEFIEVPDLSHIDPPPIAYSPHLCWLPFKWDNSCGAHVWVTSDKWGPFKGQLLYTSYGKSSLFEVLQEKVGDTMQGGVVRFPLKFDTGICRARFSPIDGQLYVGGLRGWQTDGSKDGALHRVRYTGKTVTMQNALHVTDKGIHVGFTAPLDPATAGDVGNYAIEQYNYEWTSSYGSPELKVSDPKVKGRDQVDVVSVKVAPDRKSVFLEVPGLKPVMQMEIKMNINAADGTPVPAGVGNTINVVAKEAQPGVTYTTSLK